MQAVQYARTGPPDVLEVVEVDTPEPAPGQLLVEIAAAGVNFADTGQRSGTYPGGGGALPAIPGFEVTGRVVALGADVDGVAVGEAVVAPTEGGGGYAQYAVVSADSAVALPDGVDPAAATALLVQGLTARGLVELAGRVGQDDAVLVTAAGGGVGSLAVQLARQAGARRVIAAASTDDKLALARDLGADVTVNYSAEGWHERVVEASGGTGVDVVLDAVGGDIRAAALRALATFGRAAIYGGASGSQGIDTEALQRLSFSNQALIGFALPPVWQSRPRWASAAVDDMAKQLADGRLRVHTQTWPLSEAAAAHAAMEQRSTTGKVALLP